jgi:rare lipoprotein A
VKEYTQQESKMARQDSMGVQHNFRVNIALTICLLLALLLDGCSSITRHEPHPDSVGYEQTGMASYYAKKFHHRKTASGERFDNYAMTAAHKTLPFGTEVIVNNINNGKSVTVRINDRGPFVKGRIIDLSRAAFTEIADLNRGVVKVKIRVVQ